MDYHGGRPFSNNGAVSRGVLKDLAKKYYYSVERYELEWLLSFLEECDKRYKNLEMRIANTFTYLWIISNKDLYVPLQNGDIKYKYRELRTKPTPEQRWKVNWIDYNKKIAILRKVLKEGVI